MSRRLVLDASAAIHVVRRTGRAPELLDRVAAAEIVLAPALYCAEVANALWSYVRRADLELDDAVASLESALGLVDRLIPDRELTVEAMTTAVRHHHPVYDCLYLVLARRHGAELVTADSGLAALAQSLADG